MTRQEASSPQFASALFEGRPDPRKDPKGWLDTKLLPGWDWLEPDYDRVMHQRLNKLDYLRRTPGGIAGALKAYAMPYGFYDFIYDWGSILDPRLAAWGRETEVPFVLFSRQVEFLTWMQALVEAPARGLSGKGNASKTRGCGASTLACFFSLWYWLFRPSSMIGVGSNLERSVYDADNPKALFWKLEHALRSLPGEFLPQGFDIKKHLTKGAGAGKLVNPDNRSAINGDAGPAIGRGDRRLFYVIDEHAALQYPHAAEAALSKTTFTLIRISTEKRECLFRTQVEGLRATNPPNLFEYDWWEDPRTTQKLFDRDKAEADAQGMGDIFKIEVERNVDSILVDTWIPRGLLEDAAREEPEPSGPAVLTVDVAAMGNDQSIVGWRRGLWQSALRKFAKSSDDGQQLAAEVITLAEDVLRQGLTLGAIIYELEGSGYALHSVLMGGPLRTALRPIHPGRKLSNGRHYNVRSQAWDLWRSHLENGGNIPNDPAIIRLGSALRYEWRESGDKKLLLMEDKKKFKKRLAADPMSNPMGGPSPDEADNCALSLLPVEMADFVLDDYLRAAGRPDDGIIEASDWGWAA